jgi:hypothetical protein
VYQVYVYLIEEPGLYALLHDARGTHADVLVTCNRLRLVQGAFESVGDERERRSFVDPVLWNRSGNNKDRYVQGVFATPPMGKVKCPSTKHQRPVVLRVSARYSAVCAETMKTMSLPGSLYSVSPAEYHANSFSPPTPIGASGPSFGPAINPSSETESPVRTFPMMVPSSAPKFAARNSGLVLDLLRA